MVGGEWEGTVNKNRARLVILLLVVGLVLANGIPLLLSMHRGPDPTPTPTALSEPGECPEYIQQEGPKFEWPVE